MSEIQIQHVELDDSDKDEETDRNLHVPIKVIEEDHVNRHVSLKNPKLAALGSNLIQGRRGSIAPILSARSHGSARS